MMEDLLDKYKNMQLSRRMMIVFMLAIAYPLLTFSEEIEILEEQLDSSKSMSESAKAKYQRSQKTVKKLGELEKEINGINKELEKARRYLPDEIEFDQVLATLGSYEKEFDVKIVKFIPGKDERAPGQLSYRKVPLNVELEADFNNVMMFLDKIVHQKDLVHITRVDFSPAEMVANTRKNSSEKVSHTKGIVRAKVRMTFYRKDV